MGDFTWRKHWQENEEKMLDFYTLIFSVTSVVKKKTSFLFYFNLPSVESIITSRLLGCRASRNDSILRRWYARSLKFVPVTFPRPRFQLCIYAPYSAEMKRKVSSRTIASSSPLSFLIDWSSLYLFLSTSATSSIRVYSPPLFFSSSYETLHETKKTFFCFFFYPVQNYARKSFPHNVP